MAVDSAEKIKFLIDIASASQQVIDALSLGTRDRSDGRLHKQLGDLHRIVAASQTLLKESLQPSSSADPNVDDRLEIWLSSTEPETCLDVLQKMQASIKSSSSGVASALRNVFPSAPADGRFKQAIRIFEKKRVYFYFLLNTDVWNRDIVTMGQSKGYSINIPRTIPGPIDRNINPVQRTWKKKIWSEVDQVHLEEMLEWLSAWGCRRKHEDTLELRQPDTCTWLPDTDQYQTWRYSNDAFLWLHGKPGSGKSVLTASVIDNIQNTMGKGELLAYFYCDFRSGRSTVAAEVMRSLLSQLLKGLRDLGVDPGNVLDVLVEEKRQGHTILGKPKRLATLVSLVAKQCPREPLVVVDALDECEDIGNLLDSLLYLNKGGVRLLVISRPLQVIKSMFSGLPSLSLEEMRRKVDADIKLHVRREIDSHIWLRDAKTLLKEEIIETLRRKADGMFRWIECQLNTLKGCFTPSKIRDALHSLPAGLDGTYQRILFAISKEEQGSVIAKRALMWIVAALEPLTLRQIVEALSIDLDRRTLDADSAPIHGRALLHSLSSLVTHSEREDIVMLSHFSVKEYLVGQEDHMYHLNMPDAHVQVAQQCMSYITACLKMRLQDHNEHPLLFYVLRYGFRHLSYVEPTDRILDSLVALHKDIQRHPSEWEQLRKDDFKPLCQLPSLQHDFMFYVLIRYAPDPLLRLLLCRSPFAHKEGINPLIYVVPEKIEHARTLLAHGAKLGFSGQFIDSRNFPSGLPIEAAVMAGDSELVDLFLAEGSPVPHRVFLARFLRFPQMNSSGPNIYITTRLLQTEEFVEWAVGVLNETLLRCALDGVAGSFALGYSKKGDVTAMARRLKQIGCDLTGDVSFVETLLQYAARTGDISGIRFLLSDLETRLPPDISLEGGLLLQQGTDAEIISFLIRNGTNIHVVSADESTALHYAVRGSYRCLEKTKFLCEAGCSPSAFNLQGETPMHIAAERNELSVVKHLLSVGALLPSDILLALDFLHSESSSFESMIRFLLQEGADARVLATNGDSALHSALRHSCSHGPYPFNDSASASDACLESARMLVAAGCDVRITNSFGKTSLDIAVANIEHISVVKYLLSLNTPFSPDILLSVYSKFFSPSVVMIGLLLEHGADPNAKTPDGNNALHLAVSHRRHRLHEQYRLQLVKSLVEAGCDHSACNTEGRTVLHTAAAKGYLKIVEYLLSLGALIPPDILLFGSQESYRSATRRAEVIQFLIDKGADIHIVTADGDTPLHHAIMFSSSESTSLKCTELLIAAGSDPCAFSVAHKTPTHVAAARGYISVMDYLLSLGVPLPLDILLSSTFPAMVRFLVEKGADISSTTSEGDTALHLALGCDPDSESDLLEAVKILIEVGCSIHACNLAGLTPLHAAASCGSLDIVKYILTRGASLPPDVLLVAATRGDIEMMEYLLSQGASVPSTAILAAVGSSWNKVRTLQYLVTLDGADPHAVAPNGDTALHRAVESGDESHCLETVRLLARLGCHLSLCNSAGQTPLHIVASRHHISVLKYLLSQGVQLPSDVLLSAGCRKIRFSDEWSQAAAMIRFLVREGANPCVVDNKRDTPLHFFLRQEFYEEGMWQWKIVQMLLNAGANPHARNTDGQTPVDLAEKQGPFFAKNFMRLINQAKAPLP